jgi:hypothetical protein
VRYLARIHAFVVLDALARTTGRARRHPQARPVRAREALDLEPALSVGVESVTAWRPTP